MADNKRFGWVVRSAGKLRPAELRGGTSYASVTWGPDLLTALANVGAAGIPRGHGRLFAGEVSSVVGKHGQVTAAPSRGNPFRCALTGLVAPDFYGVFTWNDGGITTWNDGGITFAEDDWE